MNMLRVASFLFMAGALLVMTGCPDDGLEGRDKPVPPGTVGAKCQTDADCFSGECVKGKCVASNTPMTVDEVCAMYVSAAINTDTENGLGLCQDGTMGNAQTMDAGMIANYCRTGTSSRQWSTRLLAAVGEGRLGVDWSKARECLSETRYMRATIPGVQLLASSEWTAVQEGVCSQFYDGLTAANGACKEDWDCPKGMGCYSDNPTAADSSSCMAKASLGQACSLDFHACAAGLYCSRTGTCIEQLPNNRDCMWDDDCQSGYCEYDSGTCRPKPWKLLGEACSRPDYAAGGENPCGEFCTTCRRPEAGAQAMCTYNGKTGDYCEDWFDCLPDLGCTNHVCGAAGPGQVCAFDPAYATVESVCAPGTYCIPPFDCYSWDGDQAGCAANEAYCAWDGEYEYCERANGNCVQLPASGACLDTGDIYGPVCDPAEGVYCDIVTNACAAFGELGAPCSEDQPCNESHGLACVSEKCVHLCEVIEDCPAGQYCESSLDVPECLPIDEGACVGDYSCPVGKYCDYPGTQCFKNGDQSNCVADSECAWLILGECVSNSGCEEIDAQGTCEGNGACAWEAFTPTVCTSDCSAIEVQADCTANTNCMWDSQYGCITECWDFDGDETGCTGVPTCEWSAADEYCNSRCDAFGDNQAGCTGLGYCSYYTGMCAARYDCSDHADNQTACEDQPTCDFEQGDQYCDTATPEAAGVCAPKLAIGEICIPDNIGFSGAVPSDDASSCINGYAVWVGPGEYDYECTVKPNPPIDYTGCLTSVNDTTHALINMVFVFGGVLFLRGRPRRRSR